MDQGSLRERGIRKGGPRASGDEPSTEASTPGQDEDPAPAGMNRAAWT